MQSKICDKVGMCVPYSLCWDKYIFFLKRKSKGCRDEAVCAAWWVKVEVYAS